MDEQGRAGSQLWSQEFRLEVAEQLAGQQTSRHTTGPQEQRLLLTGIPHKGFQSLGKVPIHSINDLKGEV